MFAPATIGLVVLVVLAPQFSTCAHAQAANNATDNSTTTTTPTPAPAKDETLLLAGTIITIALSIVFDFTNGFHDTANATATTIASKALTPIQAVLISAVFNFLPAALDFNTVSNTISKTVDIDSLPQITPTYPTGLSVTLTALVGAVFWNLITWKYGIPSSSSHALIGCLVGAGLGIGGGDVISKDSVTSIAIAIVLSPALSFTIAAVVMLGLKHLLKARWAVGRVGEDHLVFRILQIIASCWLSWAHGQNDAQKTMGVMAATLYSGGYLSAPSSSKLEPPLWVVLTAHGAIAAGTLFGGWAIIESMGMNITLITRASGFAASAGAITSIQGASALAVPVSTTQAAASAVAGSGVGAGRGVNLATLKQIGLAWIITLPCVMAIGAVLIQAARIPEPGGLIFYGIVIFIEMVWGLYVASVARGLKDIKARLAEKGAGVGPVVNGVVIVDSPSNGDKTDSMSLAYGVSNPLFSRGSESGEERAPLVETESGAFSPLGEEEAGSSRSSSGSGSKYGSTTTF